jgi:response regulator RpfG family c-di-GMP phosphodiesterase
MNFDNALQTLQESAHETPEERANRLAQTATEHDVAEETLYDVERALRAAVREEAMAHSGRVDRTKAQLQSLAPMLGLHPEDAADLLTVDNSASVMSQVLVGNPTDTARAVRRVHAVFREHGLYEELGTPEPEEGE